MQAVAPAWQIFGRHRRPHCMLIARCPFLLGSRWDPPLSCKCSVVQKCSQVLLVSAESKGSWKIHGEKGLFWEGTGRDAHCHTAFHSCTSCSHCGTARAGLRDPPWPIVVPVRQDIWNWNINQVNLWDIKQGRKGINNFCLKFITL